MTKNPALSVKLDPESPLRLAESAAKCTPSRPQRLRTLVAALRKAALPIIFSALCLAVVSQSMAQGVVTVAATWDGGGVGGPNKGGGWGDEENWMPNGVPDNTPTVLYNLLLPNVGGEVERVVTALIFDDADERITVEDLQIEQTGGTNNVLRVDQDLTVNNDLTLTANVTGEKSGIAHIQLGGYELTVGKNVTLEGKDKGGALLSMSPDGILTVGGGNGKVVAQGDGQAGLNTRSGEPTEGKLDGSLDVRAKGTKLKAFEITKNLILPAADGQVVIQDGTTKIGDSIMGTTDPNTAAGRIFLRSGATLEFTKDADQESNVRFVLGDGAKLRLPSGKRYMNKKGGELDNTDGGSATIDAELTNTAGAKLSAVAEDGSMAITGNVVNAGEISLSQQTKVGNDSTAPGLDNLATGEITVKDILDVDGQLKNAGKIELDGGTLRYRDGLDITETGTLKGQGTVSVFPLRAAGAEITNDIINRGLIEADAEVLEIEALVLNDSVIYTDNLGTINFSGSFINGSAACLAIANGAEVNFSITEVVNEGNIAVFDANTTLIVDEGNGKLRNKKGAIIAGKGRVNADVEGKGIIDVGVKVGGSGGGGSSSSLDFVDDIGTLTIEGSYTQEAQSELFLEIAGPELGAV